MADDNQAEFVAIFPTLICQTMYPAFEEEAEGLIEAAYDVRKADQQGIGESARKYDVGYTSYFSCPDLSSLSVFENLVRFIAEKVTALADAMKIDRTNASLDMGEFWLNINSTYAFHSDHNHPNAHFSGVFYLQATAQSGKIIFRDPREARSMHAPDYLERTNLNSDVVSIPPTPGNLLVFPAWLYHGVEQNLSDEERISLSFNFEVVRR